MADLPPEHVTELSPLTAEVTSHQILNLIEQHHKWPESKSHTSYLIKCGSGSKAERTITVKFRVKNDPIAIRDFINAQLRENHISDTAEAGTFGYATGAKKPLFSLYLLNVDLMK